MRILALLTPVAGKSMADFQPHVLAEEQALWPMYKRGLVREMHFQPEPLTASLVFEAGGAAEVEAALGGLPMVREGLLEAKLVMLGPWLLPIEALFGTAPLPQPAPADAGPAVEDLARRFYAAVETGDEAALRRVLAPDWEELPAVYPGQPPGPGGYTCRRSPPSGRPCPTCGSRSRT